MIETRVFYNFINRRINYTAAKWKCVVTHAVESLTDATALTWINKCHKVQRVSQSSWVSRHSLLLLLSSDFYRRSVLLPGKNKLPTSFYLVYFMLTSGYNRFFKRNFFTSLAIFLWIVKPSKLKWENVQNLFREDWVATGLRIGYHEHLQGT